MDFIGQSLFWPVASLAMNAVFDTVISDLNTSRFSFKSDTRHAHKVTQSGPGKADVYDKKDLSDPPVSRKEAVMAAVSNSLVLRFVSASVLFVYVLTNQDTLTPVFSWYLLVTIFCADSLFSRCLRFDVDILFLLYLSLGLLLHANESEKINSGMPSMMFGFGLWLLLVRVRVYESMSESKLLLTIVIVVFGFALTVSGWSLVALDPLPFLVNFVIWSETILIFLVFVWVQQKGDR